MMKLFYEKYSTANFFGLNRPWEIQNSLKFNLKGVVLARKAFAMAHNFLFLYKNLIKSPRMTLSNLQEIHGIARLTG